MAVIASADLLSKIRGELDARLRELRPLLSEYERLLAAADALDGAGEDTPAPPLQGTAPTPRRGRPPGGSSAGRSESEAPARAPSKPASPRQSSAPKRAQRGAAAVAIVAALEHGSHTVSELAIVTAMSAAIINNNLRRLQQTGTITRTKREGDGKAAYALTVAPV